MWSLSDKVNLEDHVVRCRWLWLRGLATTERTPTRGPRGMSVRSQFPRKITVSGSQLFANLSVWVLAERELVGFRTAGDVNHGRISVPGVRALSQQRLTSFDHYESAWRTENTGSSPALLRPVSESVRTRRSGVASTIQIGPRNQRSSARRSMTRSNQEPSSR
jgi:hypothetical protein